MRKAAVVLAVVALVLALAVVLVPLLVPLDSLRPRITSVLEQKTGRKISLSGLSLSLFPGIGVRIAGLTVAGDPRHSAEPLLSVPKAEARVAILPLLSGKAEFTRLILEKPRIRFYKYADGTTSVTGILKRLAQGQGVGGGGPASSGAKETVRVVLRSMAIEDADLSLRIEDKRGRETRWDLSSFRFRLSGLGARQKDVTFGTRIGGAVRGEVSFAGTVGGEAQAGSRRGTAVRGEGTVFGQKMTVAGSVRTVQDPASVDLAVSFPGIRLDGIADIFPRPPTVVAQTAPSGVAPVAVHVAGSAASLAFSVKADLSGAGVTLRAADPRIRKAVGTPCTLVVEGRYAPDRIVVSRARLSLPPLSGAGDASLDPATGELRWEASATVSSLAELAKALDAEGLSDLAPQGRVTAHAKGGGKAGPAESVRGEVDLAGVGFRLPGRPVAVGGVTGKIALSPSGVGFSPLAGLVNGRRFSLDGKVSLGPVLAAQADLRLAYLDVDALFPPAAKGGDGRKAEKAAKRGAKGATAERKVSARVNVAIDAGRARGVEFADLKCRARYEKGTLVLDDLRARMYGGEVAVTGDMALAAPAPRFRVRLAAKRISVEKVLGGTTSLHDFLSGLATLSADLSGGMSDFADFTRTATGKGSVRIADGKIKGVDLLARTAGVAGFPSPVAGAPASGGETSFSDLSASFRIDQGKIRTDSLRIVSDKLALAGSAAVGFDRTLDFRGVVRLSQGLSQRVRGTVGKFLRGKDGRVAIPLVIGGTLTSPAVAIDSKALATGAAEHLLQGLTDRLTGGAAAPAGDNNAPERGREKKEPLKELEGLFRTILPGK